MTRTWTMATATAQALAQAVSRQSPQRSDAPSCRQHAGSRFIEDYNSNCSGIGPGGQLPEPAVQ